MKSHIHGARSSPAHSHASSKRCHEVHRAHGWAEMIFAAWTLLAAPAVSTLFPLLACPALLPFITGCEKGDKGEPVDHDPEDFLPVNLPGWDRAEQNRTGTDYDDLYAAIGEPAVIYTRHHMSSFAFASFIGTGEFTGATLTVLVTKMQTEADANALYDDSDLVFQPNDPIPDLGEEARLTSGLAESLLQFRRDMFYVELKMANAPAGLAENELLAIGADIDVKMAP